MLLDVARKTRTAQGLVGGWQCWSKDSKFLYFLELSGDPGVFRVSVDNNKLERILSLKGFRELGTYGAWLSLTPEDDPLVLRDVSPPRFMRFPGRRREEPGGGTGPGREWRTSRTFRFGVFELDPRAGELRKQGMKIKLQGQPVQILVDVVGAAG